MRRCGLGFCEASPPSCGRRRRRQVGLLTGEEGGDGLRGNRDLKIVGGLIGSQDTGGVLKHSSQRNHSNDSQHGKFKTMHYYIPDELANTLEQIIVATTASSRTFYDHVNRASVEL